MLPSLLRTTCPSQLYRWSVTKVDQDSIKEARQRQTWLLWNRLQRAGGDTEIMSIRWPFPGLGMNNFEKQMQHLASGVEHERQDYVKLVVWPAPSDGLLSLGSSRSKVYSAADKARYSTNQPKVEVPLQVEMVL